MKKNCLFIIVILILLTVLTVIVGCNNIARLTFEKEAYYLEPEDVLVPKLKSHRKKYSLISSNPSIAKIKDNQVIAIREGIITLTAFSGDDVATTTVYIIHQEEYEGEIPLPLPEYVRISFFIEDYVLTSPMEVRKGAAPGAPYSFSRGGYKLDGWYKDKDCTIKYDFNEPVTQHITVFGKWIMQSPQYLFTKIDDHTSYIKGLVYPNVPYTNLDNLPVLAKDGTAIIGIADEAFKDKTTIEKVTIPKEYTQIGTMAFEGCTNLKKIEIPQNSQLQIIKNNAFHQCKELEEFYLPALIERVDAFAFYKCSKLSIQETLPTNLKILEQYVFSQTATISINLNFVSELYEGAFANCTQLATVLNTNGITRCTKLAFDNTKVRSNSILENNGVAYIDTILVGATTINPFILKENTTLIANEALLDRSKSKFKHVILTIQGTLPAVGKDCFDEDMAILIDDEFYQDACEHHPQWQEYRRQIYTQFEKDDFLILKRIYANEERFSIRKYKGKAVHLNLDNLNFAIENIWQGAFHNNMIASEEDIIIKTLTMGNVKRIREYAINNVNSLLAIIISGDYIINLESNMSIQQNDYLKFYIPEFPEEDNIEDAKRLLNQYKRKWPAKHNNYIYSYNGTAKEDFLYGIIENGLALSIVPKTEKAFIIQYLGDSSTLIIPNEIHGYPISEIVSNAFRYNNSIKHVIIGENIKQIGQYAFYHTNIEKIEFLSAIPPQIDGMLLSSAQTTLEQILIPEGSLAAYKEALPQFHDKLIEVF